MTKQAGLTTAQLVELCTAREVRARAELARAKELVVRPGYEKRPEKKRARDQRRLEALTAKLAAATDQRQKAEALFQHRMQVEQSADMVATALARKQSSQPEG